MRERVAALVGPPLAGSVYVGFSFFACLALGLPHHLGAYLLLMASCLVVYGADLVIDQHREGRRAPSTAWAWVVAGVLGMLLAAPTLTLGTLWVVLLYLPFGLLWTVPIVPCPGKGKSKLSFCAPRDLTLKPYLLSTLLTLACVGLPAAQVTGEVALPLGPRAFLLQPLYVLLVVAFITVSSSVNAFTMDAADFFDASAQRRARGLVRLGFARVRLLWAQSVVVQLVLAMVIALGADNVLVSASCVVGASYTALSSHAVFRARDKGLRALACDAQGMALLVGFALALAPQQLVPRARPFADTLLSTPERWPAWLMATVLWGALLWLVAYALMLRVGARDRTCAMPAVALLFNLGWELNHAFVAAEPFPSNAVNVAWFVLDLGLMAQLVRHLPERLTQRGLPRALTGPVIVLGALMVYAWQVAFDVEFDNRTGEYSACIANTLMSALFLAWGLAAPTLRGQRVSIALAKGAGSALYVLPIYVLTESPLLLAQGLLTLLLDAAYLTVLIVRTQAVARSLAQGPDRAHVRA